MNLIDAEILENRQVLPGHTHVHARGILSSWLIWFKCPEIAREAKPGQFIMVRCGPETTLPRPFSIHQVDGNNIALLYAVREGGRGTGWLAEQEDGQSVTVFGPLGNGFALPPTPQNLLLVAGGTGIAPLTFLADTAKSKGSMVHLHQGVNTASQLLDALPTRYVQVPYSNVPAEATLYGRPDSIPSSASTVDGSAGTRGLATVCMPGLAAWADKVFACGPVPMLRYMALNRRRLGLEGKPVQISLEVRMGCGVGVCYGCTVKTKKGLKQVCKDGPVFNLDEILWDELTF